jgi:hypothetical protein
MLGGLTGGRWRHYARAGLPCSCAMAGIRIHVGAGTQFRDRLLRSGTTLVHTFMIWPEIRSFEQQAFALARLSLQLACCNRSITDKYSASFNPHWGVHRFGSPVARAFRTFDCEIPNWRAILAGVTPALKAARTTFICPRVSVVSAMSTRRRWKKYSLLVIALETLVPNPLQHSAAVCLAVLSPQVLPRGASPILHRSSV